MNTPFSSCFSKKCALAAGVAFLSAVAAHAQFLALGLPHQRALGQRYVEAGAGVLDAKTSLVDRPGPVFSTGANLPLTAHLDLGVNYGYGRVKIAAGRLSGHAIASSAVLHTGGAGAKPFVGVLLGYERTRFRIGTNTERDDTGMWALAGGVEIPLGALTLTPALTYADEAKNGDGSGVFHWSAQASYWFTSRVGGYADVTFSNFRNAAEETWTYRAGVRFGF